jgi:hypothetical protein
MKKLLIAAFLSTLLFAATDNNIIIQNIIGKQQYETYKGLLHTLINDKNATLNDIITVLKENGLINLFFNKPKLIHPSFIFTGNSPLFETKILYMTLQNLGYYYFYPYQITKDSKYKITLELTSKHHIDPQNFMNEIETFKCKVTSLKNVKGNFVYQINCSNAIMNVPKITDKLRSYLNAKGIYWFNVNGFKQVYITTSKFDNWYPYIAFYDKHLNVINIIKMSYHKRSVIISIPSICKYIKIGDNYTKENFKRGIFIKGIK